MQLIEVDIGMEYRTVGEILNINTKWSTIGIPSALRWIKSNRSCSHICFFRGVSSPPPGPAWRFPTVAFQFFLVSLPVPVEVEIQTWL
jgi:hypothetical protein